MSGEYRQYVLHVSMTCIIDTTCIYVWWISTICTTCILSGEYRQYVLHVSMPGEYRQTAKRKHAIGKYTPTKFVGKCNIFYV